MDHDNKKLPSTEHEQLLKTHQTNLIAYIATTLFGVLMAAVLIPNFVKVKKNADFGPEKFPYIVAGIFIVLGLTGLVLEFLSIRRDGVKMSVPHIQIRKYIPQAVMILTGFAFIFAASAFGFLITAALFTVVWLFLYGSGRWKFNIIWAIAYSVLIYLLFSQILGIRFTGGVFGI